LSLYRHAEEFLVDGDWSRVLAAGDVYKNGAFPDFTPDEDMALRLYHICASCPDSDVSGLGQARYVELRLDPVAKEDRSGLPLPTEPGGRIAAEARDRIGRTPHASFGKPTRQRIGALERPAFTPRDSFERQTARADVEGERFGPETGRHNRSDAQNVHDHGVASGVRVAIEEMAAKHGTPAPQACEEAVRRTRDSILSSGEPEGLKRRALAVLEALTDARHGSLGASAQEALALVISEIDGQPGSEERGDLENTLVKQLASGEEDGQVVCLSGKISRIVGTFDGTGILRAVARPIWAIRDEIGGLAARVRDEHADDTDGSAAKAEFVRLCKEEYVERLGMSERILGPIVNEYADAL
jgi:hypothetical protein